MKVTVTNNRIDRTTTITGTPEQQEIRAMEYDVKKAVIHLLAEQYVKEHGHEILNQLSPQLIAIEVQKNIASKLL